MSKYLDKAIKEMRNYGDMGLPDGETSGGMGSQESKNPVVNAYRLNNILRRRQAAEEEETNDDYDAEMQPDDMSNHSMDDEEGMGMDDGVDTEELKIFFQENPNPSDEEIQLFAEERGIDMEQMRQEVYTLIQSLLGEEGDDNEDDMGGEIEFSAPVGGDAVPDEEDLQQGM